MCYWVGTRKVRAVIEQRFNDGTFDEIDQLFYDTFIAKNQLEFQEHYVAIGKGKPILSTLTKEKDNLKFKNMEWTLPYSYTDQKGNTITRELQNSTCERVFTQHKDIIFTRRCIVPIDGYFEYHHFKNEKYPYYIYPSDGGIFYAGGIWNSEVNKETGEVKENFSIITTNPNPLTGRIHNNPDAPNGPRMLVLIHREKALDYLEDTRDIKKLSSFFIPMNENYMKAHTVIKFQKKEYLDYQNSPKVLDYREYPELVYKDQTLF